MMRLLLALAVSAWTLFAWNPDEQPNVNSRYTVESVHVTGKRTSRLNQNTRHDLESVVGQKLDHSLLNQLASRIRKELRVEKVAVNVSKGTKPGQVTVEFSVEGGRRRDFDIDASKGVYHSKQGWSGGLNVQTSFGDNEVGLGILSDGDSRVERYAGVRARYERNPIGTDRLSFRVSLDSYHQQWNSATLAALSGSSHFSPDLYRSSLHVSPTLTFLAGGPFRISAGITAVRLDPQAQGDASTANALTGVLAFHESWDRAGSRHDLTADYSLRAGTGMLASDYVYARHVIAVAYRLTNGHNTIAVDFLAGRITGDAPLFERFVLGNGSTLRGWNKFDLDPLGGGRVAHGSLGYSYRAVQFFYDSGAIWDAAAGDSPKQSAGFGFGRAGRDGFLLAVAFPLRSGHIDPIFIAGFNF